MIPRTLDHIHRAIIEHCSKRLVALKPLEGKVAPHTPLYLHAAELRRWGLLSNPKKGLWATTDAGLRALDDARAGIPENPLDALYPPLRLLPMPLRALVRLLMIADVARRHRLRESHHPSGLLFGPTMTLKSTTAQFLAYALGEDPTRAVILTPTESGRSVAVRKTYAGRTASMRAALGWRYVAFDEYHKASPATKRMVAPYIQGQLTMPIENDVLAVKPVALVIMNALPGKTLPEMSGFGPAELRRMIPCLTDPKDIPEAARFRGDAIVEAAKKAGPARLPEPTGVRFRPEDVAPVLQPGLAADARDSVDYETYAMLAEAMSGVTDDPIPFVVRDLLVCLQTFGMANSTWPAHVAGSGVTTITAPPPTSKPLTVREQTLAVLDRVGHVVDGGLDAYVHVQMLDALLREEKLNPKVTLNRVKVTLSWEKVGYPWPVLKVLYAEWKKTRDATRFSQAVLRIVERFETFEKWEKTLSDQKAFLAEHGGSWEDVKEVKLFRGELHALGLSVADGRTLLRRLLEEGKRQGKEPAEAVHAVFDAVRVHDDLYAAAEEHKSALARAQAEIGRAEVKSRQDRIAWENERRLREQERAGWEKERAKWETEKAPHDALVREREAQLTELGARVDQLAAREEAAKVRLAALERDAQALLRKAEEELARIRGEASTVKEALERASAREMSADRARRSYEDRSKALDEREAALRVREETASGQEQAVELGEFAKALLWETPGHYGSRAAAWFEDMAQCARSWKTPILKYADLREDSVRNYLLFLAKPWIDREYLPRTVHERFVKESDAVKGKLEQLMTHVEEEGRRHAEEKGRLEEELRKALEALAAHEAWTADPTKLTPGQWDLVAKRYGEIFQNAVKHTMYVCSGISSAHLYCGACHTYFRATMPTLEELYAAEPRGGRFVYACPNSGCGRRNVYEARVLLAFRASLAMPAAIEEAKVDG